MRIIFRIIFLVLSNFMLNAQIDLTYQIPPEPLRKIADAPKTPFKSISPDNLWMLIFERPALPPISQLTQNELKLAGKRINPDTNGPSQSRFYQDITMINVRTGQQQSISGLPKLAHITNINWAPDSKKIAFTLTFDDRIELWISDIFDFEAKKLTDATLNDTFDGAPFKWFSDSKRILFKMVDPDRGVLPVTSKIPKGPIIQSTSGEIAPVRTYQNLLTDNHDEQLFEYYFISQLMIINLKGKLEKVNLPQLISSFSISPNGKYLKIDIIHKPYSYLVPYYRFPKRTEIWDISGEVLQIIEDLPLAENIPISYDAVRQGRRSIYWRSDHPAMLYWTEAQDEGDPKNEVEFRDIVYISEVPFDDEPTILFKLEQRYNGIGWGRDNFAIIYEGMHKTRKNMVWQFDPSRPANDPTLIFDLNSEDRYNDPGNFDYIQNKYGHWILNITAENELFLTGDGAGPEGDLPFLDKLNLTDLQIDRIWQCERGEYEFVVSILDETGQAFITRKESKTEYPNYYVRKLNSKHSKLTALTHFKNPIPESDAISKQIIKYNREDGLELSGTLYLPADYNTKYGTLPVLMWAYPTEFKSADAAGQMQDSPDRFVRLSYWSPAIWVLRGYAVLDDPAMPIVGEGDEEPNDTFIDQLVANAQAAIDAVVDMGIADPERIAIGGHSYGAFMTANLLAHSDLFAAGIARTGAFNRTLTPFGFQAEQRSFWEAPEVYFKMSPFMYANSIKSPLLLIHGENDSNSGTFPMQSERFFNAIKGNGGTSRLVLLPYEGHSYKSRESIMHMLWEMSEWLNKSLMEDEE